MDITFLLKGLLIGFSIAAPVGPVGVLCIRRTLVAGRASGLVSGLGAATADALYGSVAAFGIVFISDLLVSQQYWLHLVGGLFLCYLGVRTLISHPSEGDTRSVEKGLFSAYISTFFLTLTNPLTILSFASVFAGLGLAGARRDYLSSASLVAGVFTGSACWWLLLSWGVSLFRQRFTVRMLRWANITSGIIIIGFGLIALFTLLA